MKRRPESIRKLALIIIIVFLILNMVFFLLDVKKIQISDPPKAEQIIINEPQIDTTQ
jgi:hypothetical protein